MNNKLLIVDDSDDNIKILKIVLERNNYEFCIAKNGAEALDIVKNNQFDLILLDLAMPKMNGFEFMEILNNEYKDLNIPIIVLTVHYQPEQIQKAKELGAIDYIFKPFNSVNLLKKIEKYINKLSK